MRLKITKSLLAMGILAAVVSSFGVNLLVRYLL